MYPGVVFPLPGQHHSQLLGSCAVTKRLAHRAQLQGELTEIPSCCLFLAARVAAWQDAHPMRPAACAMRAYGLSIVWMHWRLRCGIFSRPRP